MTKRIRSSIVDWLAARFGVPRDALAMFRAASQVSGFESATLPTELVPLNSIQLARGVLNFTILQMVQDWVLPYWAVRQFDPSDVSFIPRSHLGLSMNVTHRNWTAVGNPLCDVEPIVDQRGLLTPFRNGWSIDTWLCVDGVPFFPSRQASAVQQLVEELPVVATRHSFGGCTFETTAFTRRNVACEEVCVVNNADRSAAVELGIAVRPFNPEGVSLIRRLAWDATAGTILINGSEEISCSPHADGVLCSSLERGDVAASFGRGDACTAEREVECTVGLATCCAVYRRTLAPGDKLEVTASVDLEGGAAGIGPSGARQSVFKEWHDSLREVPVLDSPDRRVNAAFRAASASLLALVDGSSLTPGPSTYHQFWFRDAAYMLWAMDKLGLCGQTDRIIRSFPERQLASGYFRSQQGEWDSNGQALWLVWQHTLLTGSSKTAEDLYPALHRAAEWIRTTLDRNPDHIHEPHYGLLPQGLSAEHLGMCDYYYWDDFWSLAGLEAFAALSDLLGRSSAAEQVQAEAETLRRDILRALSRQAEWTGRGEILAGPLRHTDCGMVGSVCAWYPLQLFAPSTPAMEATVTTLCRDSCREGMYFQDFIHSGMNAYLSFQLAQGLLFQGKREEFWRMACSTLAHATPTFTFPEAIHPATGGGVMGDGHHGWAAAELVSALRNAWVMERWNMPGGTHELEFLGGIPVDWFLSGTACSFTNVPVFGGKLDISFTSTPHAVEFTAMPRPAGGTRLFPRRWLLSLPAHVSAAHTPEGEPLPVRRGDHDSHVLLSPETPRCVVEIEEWRREDG